MKKKRFMRILSLLTCLCLAFLLTSCGGKPATELAQFKTEDGFYHYPGLPWGSTVEEVEAVTGWNVKDNFVSNLYYDQEKGTLQTLYTVQDIPIDGKPCIIELQFDPDGGLWCTSVYIPIIARDLPKQFAAYEKELIKAFGKPDKTEHNVALEENSVTRSSAGWYVWDEDEKLVNVCGLSFSTNLNYGDRESYLLFMAKWKDSGFLVIE